MECMWATVTRGMSVLFSILFDIRFTQAGITAITSTPAAAKRVGAFTFKSLINHNHTRTRAYVLSCVCVCVFVELIVSHTKQTKTRIQTVHTLLRTGLLQFSRSTQCAYPKVPHTSQHTHTHTHTQEQQEHKHTHKQTHTHTHTHNTHTTYEDDSKRHNHTHKHIDSDLFAHSANAYCSGQQQHISQRVAILSSKWSAPTLSFTFHNHCHIILVNTHTTTHIVESITHITHRATTASAHNHWHIR